MVLHDNDDSNDTVPKDETIRLRVTEIEKQDIEQHVEKSPKYDDISDMLRTLIHVEMSDKNNEPDMTQDEVVSAVEMGVSEVMTRLDDVQSELAVVKTELSDEQEIKDLAAELYDYLPVHSEENPFTDRDYGHIDWDRIGEMVVKDYREQTYDSLTDVQERPSAYALAEWLDESVNDVQRALNWAESFYPDLHIQRPPKEDDRMPIHYYRLE